jgi:tetratricopeptide (TPR) repeat protein
LRPAKRLFSTEVALIAGALAAVVALMAHSVVDFNAHIPSNTLFFAFIFGLLASPSSDPQMTGTRATGSLRAARVILSVGGALMLLTTAPLLRGEFDAEWARVQLRCKEYVDASADLSQRVSRVLPTITSGTVFPTDPLDRPWPMVVARDHLLPRAITFAQRGIEREARNPDLFYYLGEAHHFAALFSAQTSQRAEQFDAAARAYERASQLFPADIRILLNLARAYENTGRTDRAEAVLAKAFAADPKLGNVYAHYGFHLWRQKKLTRSEAYYRRALSMDGQNKIARAGMGDIERLRRLSNDPQHVELYGDPLESFELDPPNEDDERRGVRLDE